ncbi:hypothetical protein STSP_19610 [Streptomyces jeddahensis]|uniref:Uncharacterized protein n=1 Tax=Streptomyces jeddahensis TaxID=1716141 RepID=A0A177HVK2_9ACTN|nr:hypothetical protein STSP_19610 [Streptomyces jeddahensis]
MTGTSPDAGAGTSRRRRALPLWPGSLRTLAAYGNDEEQSTDDRKRQLMSEHVHVRLPNGMGVSEDGRLVELSRCRCGATFTKVYEVEDGEPE